MTCRGANLISLAMKDACIFTPKINKIWAFNQLLMSSRDDRAENSWSKARTNNF